MLVPDWNTTAAWTAHEVVVPLDADLAGGRQLRVRLLFSGRKLWIPLVSPYQSRVTFTG